MFHPAEEIKVVLETLVVVVEVILVGIITLVIEETSMVDVALVAAIVVVDMVAEGMAMMDLVMMEAILEVVKGTRLWQLQPSVFKFWTHERKRFWKQKVRTSMVVEANILPNHRTKVAMVVPAATVAMAVAEGFNYCQEIQLRKREEPET